jgi:flagellar hook protein FlgE
MMRSLYAGVQGLRAHQVRMDVIGNNIANVNTTGFKASRVNFADMYSQTMAGAGAPSTARGGTNPKQVGLGVGIASIDTIMADGSLQLTGKTTDLAVSGNGFFVLRDGSRYLYTRAGNFDFDSKGYLVNPATGQRLQGWMPDASGTFPTRELANLSDLQLPVADSVLASASNRVTFDQSLNAAAAIGSEHVAATTVIDSLGREHSITLSFTKVADNAWDVIPVAPGGAAVTMDTPYLDLLGPAPAPGAARLQFNENGSLMDNDMDPDNAFEIRLNYDPGAGAEDLTVQLDFTKVMQPALPQTLTSTLRALEYNGYPTGALTNISIDAGGTVTGYYSNGQYRQVAQIALANFFNPGGLMKDTANNWVESPNSGFALVGEAGISGRGGIASGNLEMSNVDIPAEFTNMIVTQRGFQANARIITTTDEILQEIVNLKR